jgi:hypothetical protein
VITKATRPSTIQADLNSVAASITITKMGLTNQMAKIALNHLC